jgi:hypothetical protein
MVIVSLFLFIIKVDHYVSLWNPSGFIITRNHSRIALLKHLAFGRVTLPPIMPEASSR